MATEKLGLLRIISGGQTGADQGALLAARKLGIPTGGTAPQGWWTEKGCEEQMLREFGLIECATPGYEARTRQNVLDSDGTLIVGDDATGGTALTVTVAKHSGKPLFHVPNWLSFVPERAAEFREWLKDHEIQTLNVAGNRESQHGGIENFTMKWLVLALGGGSNR